MMSKLKTYILFFLLFFSVLISAQTSANIFVPSEMKMLVVMKPTGKMMGGLPEMTPVSDTTELYSRVNDIVNASFVQEAIELYFLAETYLYHKNQLPTIEPAYLALSKNDGGFAKVGFHLKTKTGHVSKTTVPYIDIVESRIQGSIEKLMSITQLYPHEMGHLIYGMLNLNKGIYHSRSLDMHYFSVITDYTTAFHEGFAEHIENVSRLHEENEAIKQGIFSDIKRIKGKSVIAIEGFEKDLTYPIRLGYFKISMPLWYQKYENLKRYDHVINGKAKFLNSTPELNNLEDQLTYRNAGLQQNENNLRNYVQTLSTEGVISTFFTKLTQSEVADHFLEADFYSPFLMDTTAVLHSPKEVFSPMQNQFLKYFVVFHEYMPAGKTSGSAFVDFIEGYIDAFPSEELMVKKIFKEATGLDYTRLLPPQIWLLVKNYSHRLIVPDPYGAFTVPAYTFDLNAAETEDLLTLKGLHKEEALKIIEYRNSNGFFNSLDQIKEIKGISIQSGELIINSKYDEAYIDGLAMPELNFMSLLTTPLRHLMMYLMLYFIVVFAFIYFFFLRKEKRPVKKIVPIFFIYLLQWIIFVLGGLMFAVSLSHPLYFLIFISAPFLLINTLKYKKDKARRNRSLFATSIMSIFILFSLL
jgi:hypothetical protein